MSDQLDRLDRALTRLRKLYDNAKSDMERKAIEAQVEELAADAEIKLTSLSGLMIPMIRKGLVQP